MWRLIFPLCALLTACSADGNEAGEADARLSSPLTPSDAGSRVDATHSTDASLDPTDASPLGVDAAGNLADASPHPADGSPHLTDASLPDIDAAQVADASPPPPDASTCIPVTCDAFGTDRQECGTIDDGCGGRVSCGECTLPETCGGAGSPSQCGYQTDAWETEVLATGGTKSWGYGAITAIDTTVHVSYWDGSASALTYAQRSNTGRWTKEVLTTSVLSVRSDIAASTERVHALYSLRGELVYAFKDTNGWSTDIIRDTNDLSYPTLDLQRSSTHDQVRIAYSDQLGVEYADSLGGPDPRWLEETAAWEKPSSEVSIAAQDTVSIVYVSAGALKLASWDFFGLFDTETISPSGAHSTSSDALVVSPAGTILAAYRTTNGSVRVAERGQGQDWVFETVESKIDGQPAIGQDASGTAFIAFVSRDTADLKLARRVANGPWVVETVDSLGDVSSEVSLHVTDAGAVHILYFEETLSEWRYAYLRPE